MTQDLYVKIDWPNLPDSMSDELLEYSTNVKMVGNLPKQEYYELLSNCAYMLYPTDFPEISCINAIEAQYNECMVIATHNFALSETVKSQTTVKSKYDTQEYFDEFLSLVKKYQDEELYTQAVTKARVDIEKYSWQNVAKSWNREIDSMFEEASGIVNVLQGKGETGVRSSGQIGRAHV